MAEELEKIRKRKFEPVQTNIFETPTKRTKVEEPSPGQRSCEEILLEERGYRISQIQILLNVLKEVYSNVPGATPNDINRLVQELATLFKVPFPPTV